MSATRKIENFELDRRGLFGAVAAMIAAGEFGVIEPVRAQASAAKQSDAPDASASFGPLKQIEAGALAVGYAKLGPADGTPVLLLHGWPYDIHSFGEVAPILTSAGHRVIVPYLRGYGTTRFLSGETLRNGQQSVIAVDAIALRRPFSAASIGARGPPTSWRRYGRNAAMASSR
jgi:hypothetical protein